MEGDSAAFNSQLDAFTLYHLIQDGSEKSSASSGIGPALPALGHALAGAVATASAKVLIYPLELCITRLQVQRQLRGKGETESAAKDADKEYSSLVDAVLKIYKTEGGLKAFYTGCAPAVGKGVIDSFLFFLFYTFLRQWEHRRAGGKHLAVSKELGIGIVAGSFAKFFTTPIQNIVTRQQTAALIAARDPTSTTTRGESDSLTVKDIALQIRSERGLAGFWAGYSESIILTINPAITFAMDNFITRLLPESRRKSPSPQSRFLIAALSKAVATTLTYPAMLAKSRAQVSSPATEEGGADTGGAPELLEKSSTLPSRQQQLKTHFHKLLRLLSAQYAILTTLRKIYRTEGLAGLYSGLEGEVLKGFLSHGLTMMVKDKVHLGVIQTYYLLLKATRRWPVEIQKAKDEARDGAKGFAAKAQRKAVGVGETMSDGAQRVLEKVGGQSKD